MESKNYKELRLKCGLTQSKAAKDLGISREFINRIESGKKNPSEELAGRLNEYYRSFLNAIQTTDDVTAIFDWVRVRFPTNDWQMICEKVLCIDPDLFFYKHTGKYGYVECYYYGNIQILNSKNGDSRGVLVDMSGQGCRNYEVVLDELNQRWHEFFSRCRDIGKGTFTRLDCALDDKKEIISIPKFADKWRKGYLKTDFKVVKVIDERLMKNNSDNGMTIYFGSRNGTIHFAFYQKDYEQAKKKKIAKEDVEVKNRYEIRLMDEKANRFIDEFLTYYDCSLLIRSIIDKYVTFFDYDKYRKELVVSKEWNELLKETIDVDFSMEPKEVSFEKSYRWMNYQGGRVLKKLRLYGEYTGEDLIEKIIENAELSDEDEMQVEQATTDSANIVVLEGIGYLNRETGQIFGGSYG